MSTGPIAIRLPVRIRVPSRSVTISAAPESTRRQPSEASALARVARDVSPSVRGGLRHFVW